MILQTPDHIQNILSLSNANFFKLLKQYLCGNFGGSNKENWKTFA